MNSITRQDAIAKVSTLFRGRRNWAVQTLTGTIMSPFLGMARESGDWRENHEQAGHEATAIELALHQEFPFEKMPETFTKREFEELLAAITRAYTTRVLRRAIELLEGPRTAREAACA